MQTDNYQEFTNQYFIRHEFIKRLHKRYRVEGIDTPFPIRTIRMEGLAIFFPLYSRILEQIMIISTAYV